ncbi:MAG TPA: hypothetical protein VF494_09065 [Candidatus Limnocylindrales bacterium]
MPTASALALWPTDARAPAPNADGPVWLQHIRWGDTGGPVELLAIRQDGRVVADRSEEPHVGLRQLSPAGLSLLRAQIAAIGLFDRTQTRKLTKPLNCCGAGDQVRVTTASRTVTVGRVFALGDFYLPSDAWDRFDALVDAMLDVDEWIPATSWAGPTWEPYHPASYCATVSLEGASGTAQIDGRAIDWDGILPFASFGKPGWTGATTERAGVIEVARAYALANAIGRAANAAGIPYEGGYGGASLSVGGISAPGVTGTLSLLLEADAPGFTRCP